MTRFTCYQFRAFQVYSGFFCFIVGACSLHFMVTVFLFSISNLLRFCSLAKIRSNNLLLLQIPFAKALQFKILIKRSQEYNV